jgi:hypothetical protein
MGFSICVPFINETGVGQNAGCLDLYFGQHLRKMKEFQLLIFRINALADKPNAVYRQMFLPNPATPPSPRHALSAPVTMFNEALAVRRRTSLNAEPRFECCERTELSQPGLSRVKSLFPVPTGSLCLMVGGRFRIAVERRFDSAALTRLIGVLEQL